MKDQLAAITKSILESTGIPGEIESARHLSAFYARFFPGSEAHSLSQKTNEVLLKGGIALSSYDAAICMDEYIRTARFIKGVYQAICELKIRFPDQRLHILYAGCGPYATLLLPVLPLFEPEDLDVVLLDINTPSLQSVAALLPRIGLDTYSIELLQGDAIHYQSPEARPLHLIISETMFHALIREPQVSITGNLAAQLQKGGILIPEEINLSLVYTFFTEEPYLKANMEFAEAAPYKHRLHKGLLFSINKELDFYRNNNSPGIFESDLYELPENFEERPDLCIYTQLRIFGGITLEAAESSITNPYCVNSFYNLQNHTHVKLVYNFKDIPNWTYAL